jgi:zinc protease
VFLIDKPGAPQSQIRIGGVGVARNTPDYFPIEVMNTMLGGSFSSRLNLNLREKNGFAYNAYSTFDMRRAAGLFFAGAGVQTDKTIEALREFFKELGAIREPIPPEELARARNNLALSFPERFETTGDISSNLEMLRTYDLPDDYFARYVPSILAVTPTGAHQAAEKYVQPDRVAVVVVGDLKAIEAGIRGLKLGRVTVMPLDDVFAPPR